MGGNDLYRGMIAASTDEDQGNAVVIDLNGDDTYAGAPPELATGRMGVGLLIDHDGTISTSLTWGREVLDLADSASCSTRRVTMSIGATA